MTDALHDYDRLNLVSQAQEYLTSILAFRRLHTPQL